MSLRYKVTIVKTGIANIASVIAGFERLGCKTHVTSNHKKITEAQHVVLPGVGTFAAGMRTLRAHGIDEALKLRIEDEKPTLSICLGLQLLFEKSEESPEETGLGIFPGTAKKFSKEMTVPHFGWNQVAPSAESNIFQTGHAYFANSFYVDSLPKGWIPSYTTYGNTFISGFEKGQVVAGQFHPELSGQWGNNFMKRWLELN